MSTAAASSRSVVSARNSGVAGHVRMKGPTPTDHSANTRQELTRLLRKINRDHRFRPRRDLAPFVNWSGNAASPIHRWLRYREAYSPNLITKLSLGPAILDPFCGCGSILIGAAQNGYSSVGIDVNPLATFAAKVKLTPLTRTQLTSVRTFAASLSNRLRVTEPWPVPGLSISSKVFEPLILDTILRIRSAFEADFAGDRVVRNFIMLAWVAILERVGSYFKEGNGIKYRNRKRLKTGYIQREDGEWQRQRFGSNQKSFVLTAFNDQIEMMLEDAKQWKKGRWAEQYVIEGNALELDRLLPERTFDSVVFSPPYANRFDYFESMKVELWFGGFVETYEDNNSLRKISVRSHLGADLNKPFEALPQLEQIIGLMDQDASSWRMGVPSLLRGYFDDMRQTLTQCHARVDRGKCYVVIGNSAFAGVIIPTDAFIASLGLECGFQKAEILVARHLTVSPQQRNQLAGLEDQMRESIVVLS